jgi:hypothetical protein
MAFATLRASAKDTKTCPNSGHQDDFSLHNLQFHLLQRRRVEPVTLHT